MMNIYTRVANMLDEHIEEGLGYEQPGVYAIVGLEVKMLVFNFFILRPGHPGVVFSKAFGGLGFW